MTEHLTNIVVVAIIHDEQNRILVARRAATQTTWPNRFELVGGHLDPGEMLEDGLQREIREEIGCEISVGPLLDAFTYHSEDIFKVELLYFCQLAPGQVPKLNPDDHSEFLWITSDEIDRLEKDDEEIAALRKAFMVLEGEN